MSLRLKNIPTISGVKGRSSSQVGDEFWSNVILFLDAEQEGVVDQSTLAQTATYNTSVSRNGSTPQYGSYAYSFQSTSRLGYGTAAFSNIFQGGSPSNVTQPFTIEFSVYKTGDGALVWTGYDANNYGWWLNSDLRFYSSGSNGNNNQGTAYTLPAGRFVPICLDFDGTTLRIMSDGVVRNTVVSGVPKTFQNWRGLNFGYIPGIVSGATMLTDSIRISNFSRYGGAYTPATEPFQKLVYEAPPPPPTPPAFSISAYNTAISTAITSKSPSISGVTVGSLCLLAAASNGDVPTPSGWTPVGTYTNTLTGSSWELFKKVADSTTMSGTVSAYSATIFAVSGATDVDGISTSQTIAGVTTVTLTAPDFGVGKYGVCVGFDRSAGSNHPFPGTWSRKLGAGADAAGGYFTPLLADVNSLVSSETYTRSDATYQAHSVVLTFVS